jgi:hypothetical protein
MAPSIALTKGLCVYTIGKMGKREAAKKVLGTVAGACAGALLNLGTMLLVQNVLHAPLFMDTMFTVACTFVGGLPWGLATAVLTHLISNPALGAPPPAYLYTFCNIAVAFLTCLFIRLFPGERRIAGGAGNDGKQWQISTLLDRITFFFILSLAMCFFMSIMGSIISTIIEVFFTSWEAYDAETFIFRRMLVRKIGENRSGPALLLIEILCRIPVNIMDRLLSVYGGYGIALAAGYLKPRAERRSA